MPVLVDNKNFSDQAFVAPTVFFKGTNYVSNYNYYATLQGAINKYLYLHNSGGANTPPAGNVAFINNGKPQTFGINVDFWVFVGGTWQLAAYSWMKTNIAKLPPCVVSMYTPTGGGLYYAIFEPYYFGISATVVSDFDPAKLGELDAFWREVQLMKFRYNGFVGFLTDLSKRQLNTVEQRVFNEGLLLLNNLSNEMSTIRGIVITYNQGGTVGLPVLLIIAVIAVLSAAAGWTITTIVTERERTKRINDSYDVQKWVVNKKVEIAAMAERGEISEASAAAINNNLDATAAVAQKVATNASKQNNSIFGDAAQLVKWAAIGYVGYLGYKVLSNKTTA